jgi:hypothetical protein
MITQNQQFDTIRLHIPEEAISKLDRSVFSIPSSKNAHTYEDDYKGVEQLWLNDIGQGINYVKYIPQLKFYDVRISAKILREKYWQGIQEDNIEDVIDKLENRMQCEIDYSQFIEQGKIIQCDNTFNLKLDLGTTKNIADYLEALDLLYKSTNNVDLKNKHYKDFFRINDSLNKSRQKAKNQFAKIRFDTEKEIKKRNEYQAKMYIYIVLLSN